jgi:Nidogen-like
MFVAMLLIRAQFNLEKSQLTMLYRPTYFSLRLLEIYSTSRICFLQNTFQLVLATDGVASFAMLNYGSLTTEEMRIAVLILNV